MEAAEYLRKSRMEEGMNTDEVLAKHRQALAGYAAAHDIHIVESYCEVVSGESLYARPEMLRLLQDVEDSRYDAVLVMDLDRLSRGRMKDQGIILDAFRESGTLIITPEKTYDLSDEIDDELAEFKTFMSRREYKIITKRLRRGLRQSIRNGCYVANAPYGYRKIYVDKQPTLEIYEPEAAFVRMMYDMYVSGSGCVAIANHINALGARPHRSDRFTRSSVAHILRNPTYAGKIVWDQKTHIRKNAKGNLKHITIYNPREKWTITDGLHPAIISQEQYDTVQDIFARRYIPSRNDGTIRSPLAGLVRCTQCGGHMQRMTMKKVDYLLCPRPGCCASAKFEFVEQQLLSHLHDLMEELQADRPATARKDITVLEQSLSATDRELTAANGQKSRLYELLELGEYDIPTFRERMAAVKEKLAALEKKREALQRQINDASRVDSRRQAAQIADVLSSYDGADAPARNALLKSIIETVWYSKAKKTKPRDFTLSIDLKTL